MIKRSGPISWALAVPVLMDGVMRHYPDAADRALAFYPVCTRYISLVDVRCPDGLIPDCTGDPLRQLDDLGRLADAGVALTAIGSAAGFDAEGGLQAARAK